MEFNAPLLKSGQSSVARLSKGRRDTVKGEVAGLMGNVAYKQGKPTIGLTPHSGGPSPLPGSVR